jgi:hypothetical protein
MRTRLSAKYSYWVIGSIALFAFVSLFILSASVGITAFIWGMIHNPGLIVFAILLFGLCIRLVTWILTPNNIIEFDDNFVYIEDVKNATEDKIPLERVTWLNLRPLSFDVGAYWFWRYSLRGWQKQKTLISRLKTIHRASIQKIEFGPLMLGPAAGSNPPHNVQF